MTVIAPADGVEVRKVVFAAAQYGRPIYLRLTRDASPVVFTEDYDLRIGKATVVRQGTDVIIITTGTMLPRALDATGLLEREGVSAHILHVPTLTITRQLHRRQYHSFVLFTTLNKDQHPDRD